MQGEGKKEVGKEGDEGGGESCFLVTKAVTKGV